MDDIKKQMVDDIPPPAFLKRVVDTHNKEPSLNEDMDKIEKTMLDFSQSDAWEFLKRFINNKRVELAGDLRSKSKGDTSLEEIGFTYLAMDMVNVFASQIITFVEKYVSALKAKEESGTGGDSSK